MVTGIVMRGGCRRKKTGERNKRARSERFVGKPKVKRKQKNKIDSLFTPLRFGRERRVEKKKEQMSKDGKTKRVTACQRAKENVKETERRIGPDFFLAIGPFFLFFFFFSCSIWRGHRSIGVNWDCKSPRAGRRCPAVVVILSLSRRFLSFGSSDSGVTQRLLCTGGLELK